MKTFLAVFNTLPSILQTVQAVETALPLPQAGAQRLNLILSAAAAAWDIGSVIETQLLSKTATLNAVQTMTNVTVASLNAASAVTATTAAPVSSK
jgi:hypothetical protein